MLQPIRRVVTGHDHEGRAVILSDEIADNAGAELPWWPGTGSTSIWTTSRSPASNRDEDIPKEFTGFAPDGSGGVGFMIMQIPPESELADLPDADRAQATTPVARLFPQAFEVDTSRSYAMHATDTVDLLVMIAGELTLLVDDGEVTLRPPDTVIQRGVNHGWVNHGAEPALIAAAVIDAEPLQRKRPSPRGMDIAIALTSRR